jgi:hypothetical protein
MADLFDSSNITFSTTCSFNKKEKENKENKTLGCPKCVGPLEVAPDANRYFTSRGHFGIRLAMRTDARGQVGHPKCVAPLD